MITRRGLIMVFWALAAGLVLLACGGAEEAEGGVLTGTVTRDPACPAEGVVAPCPPAPASGVSIVVSTADGREITSVVTDDEGTYRTDLPSGTYRVEMASPSGAVSTHDLPATVTVTEGQQTMLDVSIEAITSVPTATGTPTDSATPAPTDTEAPVDSLTPVPTATQPPGPTATPVSASTPADVQPPAGMGLLVGRVVKGPTCPVEAVDDSCPPAPVADATIVVSAVEGEQVESVATDADGNYSAFLPPGSYVVALPAGTGLTKDLPRTVIIAEGQETRLNVYIDTGIR